MSTLKVDNIVLYRRKYRKYLSHGKTGEYGPQNMDKKVSSLKWTILC
jgi:hypothetical protein